MINSAIESTSRVLMVSDESGELIAGSLVTHQIGKDRKSYVCFDSIEVNAKRARIKAADYQVTLKRIEKLKKKGIIKEGTIEELREYYEKTPQGNCKITKADLNALEANRKILETYKKASEDMIVTDEQKRKEQLRNGEISAEEYSHLLMKNGIFTIGRNPVSMYLGSLKKLDKKVLEKAYKKN